MENFMKYAPPSLANSLQSDIVKLALIQHWKQVRASKQRGACIRKFWTNPEYGDARPYTAFRENAPPIRGRLRASKRKQKIVLA